MAVGQWTTADEKQQKEWLRSGVVPADYPGPVAADYQDLLEIVEATVKPERMLVKRPVYRDIWWVYAEKQKALYTIIAEMERVLVTARVSPTSSVTWLPVNQVFHEKIVVFPLIENWSFSLLQSSLHWEWAVQYTSTLGATTLNYSPSDCFETLPFPELEATDFIISLKEIGERYYQHRQSIMQTRQEGLTKTYNRFHDPKETATDIAELRRLHVEMDQAVAAAYGWQDMIRGAGDEERGAEEGVFPAPRLNHGFHETKQGTRFTISETARREVLDRLLELNHQRYAEEVAAGLHDKKASKPAAKRTPRAATTSAGASGQLDAFADLGGGEREAGGEEREESLLTHTAPRSPLLDYLQTHPGWHGKDALLTATGFPDNRWNAEIKRLIDSCQVEREGERRGARYRFRGA